MTSEHDIVWKDVKKWCPQSPISEPTMWNFMMNDLLNKLEENRCYVTYADDVLMLIEGVGGN